MKKSSIWKKKSLKLVPNTELFSNTPKPECGLSRSHSTAKPQQSPKIQTSSNKFHTIINISPLNVPDSFSSRFMKYCLGKLQNIIETFFFLTYMAPLQQGCSLVFVSSCLQTNKTTPLHIKTDWRKLLSFYSTIHLEKSLVSLTWDLRLRFYKHINNLIKL